MATETPPAKRRVARSGPTALISSVVLVLWVVLLVWLGLIAAGNEVAGVIATIMFFVSWLLIPALGIAIIVFAIIALLFNPVPGKIMGAFAIVLPLAIAALFWGWIGGFSDSFVFA